jgi:hypothetical protein
MQSYTQLPWAGFGAHHHAACPRMHQALFNEQVKILEYQGDEVHIDIVNSYYFTVASHTPHSDYWTLKKNITPLKTLNKKDASLIPTPIDYHKKNIDLANIVTLIEPFYDPSTKKYYSAGTRFIRNDAQTNNHTIAVYMYNPNLNTVQIAMIPIAKLYTAHNQTAQAQITAFLSIIKHWIDHAETIAYVWGGCSFIDSHALNIFETKKRVHPDRALHYYHRPQESLIKTGMDCSGLIVRAAHIVGIPYYFKNTYTLAQKLDPLKKGERIKPGDLIWIQGHVMIIANLERNSIYEARAYDNGYGKIQEIEIGKVFKGVINFTDLKNIYLNNQPLDRLNIHGKPVDHYRECKILKLTSAWH